MTLASDQGSDMVSSIHALQHFNEVKCNVAVFWDPSHGCNRDFWGAVGDVDMKAYLLLVMIVLNLPHGPDESDLRYQQIRDTMMQHYSEQSPSSSPIFQSLAAQIMRESADAIESKDGMSSEECLWDKLKDETIYRKKGCKVNIGRFFSVVHDGLELVNTWTSRLFEVSVPAIEHGMIANKILPKIQLKMSGADVASDPTSTSSKKLAVGDRSLRSCGANAVVIAMSLLSERDNHRVLVCLMRLAQPCMEWHGEATRQLRSVVQARGWLLEQLRGGVFRTTDKIMGTLLDQDFLRLAGFLPINQQVMLEWDAQVVTYEDEVAALAGRFALSLYGRRVRRTLWMTSQYPHKMAFMLGTPDEQLTVLAEFKADAIVFDKLKAHVGPSKLLATCLARSCFQQLSVMQLRAACDEFNYTSDPELIEHIMQRYSTVMSSMGVEDMNNYQKNARSTNWGSRYRRPLTSLAVCVRHSLMSKKYSYDALPNTAAPIEVLPFGREDLSSVGLGSLPFNAVAGTTQKAPYWSPSAENIAVASCDLVVLRELQDRLEDVQKCWLGFFCDHSHQLMFRKKQGRGPFSPGPWLVGLFHLKDSGCICCPVECEVVGAQGMHYLKFVPCVLPTIICVTELEAFEGYRFEWRSWAWQMRHIGMAASSLCPGVRAFREGTEPSSILRLAAEKGWWQIPRSGLENIAEHRGVHVSGEATLFDVLWTLTKHITTGTDEECFAMLESRMGSLMRSYAFMAEIMDVDEGARCLQEEDRWDVDVEKKKSTTKSAEIDDFRSSFREKRASTTRTTGSGRKSNKKVPWKGPDKIPSRDHIPQAEARKLMPPDSYLWRARLSESWQARYKSLPPRSCKDSAWGSEKGAIVECLRYAWSCYLDCNGYDASECPVKGLFV